MSEAEDLRNKTEDFKSAVRPAVSPSVHVSDCLVKHCIISIIFNTHHQTMPEV